MLSWYFYAGNIVLSLTITAVTTAFFCAFSFSSSWQQCDAKKQRWTPQLALATAHVCSAKARYTISLYYMAEALWTLTQLCSGELQPQSTPANQISTCYATCQNWLLCCFNPAQLSLQQSVHRKVVHTVADWLLMTLFWFLIQPARETRNLKIDIYWKLELSIHILSQ